MTDSQINVSVIMPLYNKAQYVVRAVESVLAQSYTNFELLVIDDGSTDDGPSKVEAVSDSRIRLIKQQNAGVSAARNRGINEAKGKWIAFLDADDFWMKDYLTQQIELLERNPDLAWSATNFFIETGSQQRKGIHSNHDFTKMKMGGNEYFDNYFHARYTQTVEAWTGSIIVRKDIFEKVGMFTTTMSHGEDTDMWFRIAFKCPQIGYIPEPLAVYDASVQGSLTEADEPLSVIYMRMDRYTEMARKHNSFEELKPCLPQLLNYEIKILFKQKRYTDIRRLLHKFKEYLSKRYQLEIYLCAIFPPTIGLFNVYKKIKRKLFSKKL